MNYFAIRLTTGIRDNAKSFSFKLSKIILIRSIPLLLLTILLLRMDTLKLLSIIFSEVKLLSWSMKINRRVLIPFSSMPVPSQVEFISIDWNRVVIRILKKLVSDEIILSYLSPAVFAGELFNL